MAIGTYKSEQVLEDLLVAAISLKSRVFRAEVWEILSDGWSIRFGKHPSQVGNFHMNPYEISYITFYNVIYRVYTGITSGKLT